MRRAADKELTAMARVATILTDLPVNSRNRVIEWAKDRFKDQIDAEPKAEADSPQMNIESAISKAKAS